MIAQRRSKGESWSDVEMLLSGIKTAIFAALVVVAAIITLAWQHSGTELIGPVFSLVLIVACLCAMVFRLSRLTMRQDER